MVTELCCVLRGEELRGEELSGENLAAGVVELMLRTSSRRLR